MSLKVYDGQGRWRNKTVAFRISPEEDALLETAVALSGLTKQDYIIRRLQCRDVVVIGNPRVYKALRNQLGAVLEELLRIAVGESVSADLLDTISVMLGKGSVSHNTREFKAKNVDAERTQYNNEYFNTPIREVYRELFDEAVERYNAKQTRADRCIDDYYEKIRTGKQEKLFKEIIL